jgi:hypothetical protein
MTSPDNGSQQPADTSSRPPLPTNSPRFAQGADWIEAYRRGRPLTWTDAWTVVKIKLATSWSNALRARKTLGLCLGGSEFCYHFTYLLLGVTQFIFFFVVVKKMWRKPDLRPL